MYVSASVEDVEVGTIIYPDGYFDCLDANTPLTVKEEKGDLYVDCKEGRHFLVGQLNDIGTHYIGFSLEPI